MSIINSVNSNIGMNDSFIINVSDVAKKQTLETSDTKSIVNEIIIEDTVSISDEGKRLSNLAKAEEGACENISAMAEMIISAVQD